MLKYNKEWNYVKIQQSEIMLKYNKEWNYVKIQQRVKLC